MRLQVLLSYAVFTLLVGCAGPDARDTHDTDADPITPQYEELQASAASYMIGRQDTRRCRWPLCGGYWVRLVNRPNLRCADGALAAECYVALLDTEALGGATLDDFGSGKTVVRAAFGTGDAGEFGTYVLLRVTAAWRAATDAPPLGYFHLLEDKGIRCVRAPCFSFTGQRLNTSLSRSFSDLDLTAAGASEKQLELAQRALGEQGLVANGRFASGPVRGGVSFEATQFYLPVVPLVAPDQCATDADCSLSFYTAPVYSAADCYCPTCPIPLSATAASTYAAGWQTYCAETHSPDVCPPAPCAAPPPVACIAGMCGYAFE